MAIQTFAYISTSEMKITESGSFVKLLTLHGQATTAAFLLIY